MYYIFVVFDGDSPEVHGPFNRDELEFQLNRFKEFAERGEVELIHQTQYTPLGGEEIGYKLMPGECVIIKGDVVETTFDIKVKD